MGKQPKYDLANYDGGVSAHPEAEAKGYLLLNGGRWELHFKRNKRFVYGGMTRYRMEATPDGKGCHVTVTDPQDSSVLTTFDLPGTSPQQFTADIQAHLRALEAGAKKAAAINSGQWWLNASVFRGFGFASVFSVSETDYLGGWSRHPKGHKKDILHISQAGVAYKAFRTLFTIPWAQVADIIVEGPDQAASRVTATRLVSMGVFALAAKKKSKSAVIIVVLKNGEEACFHTEKLTATEVRAKLSPVISQLHRVTALAQAQPQPVATAPPTPAQPTVQLAPEPAQQSNGGPTPESDGGLFVADELMKLAQLRDAGVITEEQFTAQRDKLMAQ